MDFVSLTSPYSTATETTLSKDSLTFLKCSLLKDKHFAQFPSSFLQALQEVFVLAQERSRLFLPMTFTSTQYLN